MPRIYLESSIWGMLAPGQNPAYQAPTRELLDQCVAGIHSPCISDVVAAEVQQAPPDVQLVVLRELERVSPILLAMPPEAETLAQRFLQEGILPPRRLDDARHVACAMVSEIDLLVSWNYRHIANVRKSARFNAVALLAGWRGNLEIHTPLEVLGCS
jgi:hypothetical protein